MDKKYQLNFSKLQPSMYLEDGRIKKANKTISVLQDYFNDISSFNLLDIGSSTGIMTNEYAKYFKDVTGVDLDTTAVQFSSNRFNRIKCSEIILEESCMPINQIGNIFLYNWWPEAESNCRPLVFQVRANLLTYANYN